MVYVAHRAHSGDLFGDVIKLLSIRKTRQGLTPFQAFCLSTGARVGVGNIAGIGLAVTIGGPGAIFWMWVSAFLGAATGFIESTAAQLYKRRQADGSYAGGPAAYMRWGCGSALMATIFALLLAAADGLIFNSVLSNTLAISFESVSGAPRWMGGLVLASYAAWVAFAGDKRLAGFAAKIVPLMLVAYLLLALGAFIVHFDRVPEVFMSIVKSAFSLEAAGALALALL